MVDEERVFGVVDYVVFALMLLVSAGIGVFYACWGNRQKTTGEFLMGGRDMKTVPVAISILVSFMSAILILGTPAEMYREGTQYYLYTFGLIGAIVVSTVLYVPLLYPLKYTSSFEGGMKAVVWTDVFQSVVMLAGVLAVVIRGISVVGGIDEVWKLNQEWGRIEFFDFNPDPTVRHSFWSLTIGTMIGWSSFYGVNQASVQRYCALPTLQKAKLAVMLNVIGILVLLTTVCLAGITTFAYYAKKGCDPLSAKYISNANQLIPYFVMEVLGYPGLPGLFVSCLFSGALSTMSSCLNALAAVCWEDFLKPVLGERLNEGQKTLVTKLLVLVFGGAGIGTAFMAKNLGGTVLQASLSFTGAASGPLLGMFALGAFFPWANWIGAVVGGVLGLVFPLWISIGAYTVVGTPSGLEYPTYNCSFSNNTISVATTTSTILTTSEATSQHTGLSALYTVSYLWYPGIGAGTVIIVGLAVSALTGMNQLGDVDTTYLVPFFDRLICCLPDPVSRCLRCSQEFKHPKELRSEAKMMEVVTVYNVTTDRSVEDTPPVQGVSIKHHIS
ncbi:sodium-coupled monocarboxylate transporter 1-like isoform X2 [Haliotis rubra]|uniref:sodium-coupled monocarboxylate transporter 1-like isoform X2 n=1 Tax=Haliotis rubra TaxID=36100 RepID=UPI001EE5BAEE|nr:sodium-coupled monocarboxylate transporter 1-like isoform X2 [Haliotis rubra]